MSKQEIRAALEQELGADRYRQFLEELHGTCEAKQRLLYWQKEAWEDFTRAHGLHASGFEEVRELFDYCPLHQVELQRGLVPIVYGTRAPGVPGEQREFPYANDVAYGPCWHEDERQREVSFCHECRRAQGAKPARE